MRIEEHQGNRSTAWFVDQIRERQSFTEFEEQARKLAPEFFGHVVLPVGNLPTDIMSWAICWCRYIDRAAPIVSREAAIQGFVRDLECFLLNGGEFVTISTLRGLSLPEGVTDIVLTEGDPAVGTVILHRMTPQEFADHLSRDILDNGPDLFTTFATTASIIHRWQFSPSAVEERQRVDFRDQQREIEDNVIRALHIGGQGRVYISGISSHVEPAVAPSTTGVSMASGSNDPGGMTLQPSGVEVIKEVFPLLFDCRPEIRVAADRIVDAERRLKPADAVVDAAIGLETLLLNNNQELTFRVQLNYAFLADPEHRAARVATIKQLYKMRNKIVHGLIRTPNADVRAMVEASGAGIPALRDALLRFLRDPILRTKGHKLDDDYWLGRIVGPEPRARP